jgi:hypothetical protein
MKTHLDYSITLPHHDDTEATMNVSITNYQDGAVMSVEVEKKRITLNRAEVDQLRQIFIRYEKAQDTMEGKAMEGDTL